MILMIDSSDHISGKTGLTLTVTLSKDGAAFAALGGSVTEISSGWYKIALNTTDTGTLGDLAIHATATGADATDVVDQVVVLLPGDNVTVGTNNDKTGYSLTQTFPTNFSSLSIDGSGRVDVGKVGGTAQTARDLGASVLLSSGTGTGQVSLSSGTVTVGTNNDKTGYSLTQTFPTNFSTLSIDTNGRTDIIKVNGTSQTARDLGANLDTTVSSRLASSSYTTPPTAASIATTLWQDLTSGSDFTTTGSIGKLLVTDIDAAVSSRSTVAAGDIWDVTLSGHTTAGSTGAALNSASGAGDPWNTALPGSYGAGTAGKILGTNLDALVSSRSTYAGGAVASVTGNIGGNVLGSVASVTNDVGITQVGADKAWSTNSRTLTSGAGLAPTAAQNASAVWDELLSGHTTAGSAGKTLTDTATQQDPWTTDLPGTYPDGTAGSIIGRFNIPPPDTPLTVIPAPPTDVSLCRVFGYLETLDNIPASNVAIKFTLAQQDPVRSDRLISGRTVIANTQSDGSLVVDLQRNDHMTPSTTSYLVTSPQLGLQNQQITLTTDVFDLSSVVP
jgi:hypothetical protein